MVHILLEARSSLIHATLPVRRWSSRVRRGGSWLTAGGMWTWQHSTTALHIAAGLSDPTLLALLLQHTAGINALDGVRVAAGSVCLAGLTS